MQFPEFEDEYFFLMLDVVEQSNGTCKNLPYYLITHEGFYYLCVYFTGEKVRKAFIEFIEAFDATNKNICDKLLPTLGQGNMDSTFLLTLARHIRAVQLKIHATDLTIERQKLLVELTAQEP